MQIVVLERQKAIEVGRCGKQKLNQFQVEVSFYVERCGKKPFQFLRVSLGTSHVQQAVSRCENAKQHPETRAKPAAVNSVHRLRRN